MTSKVTVWNTVLGKAGKSLAVNLEAKNFRLLFFKSFAFVLSHQWS